ncbi:MAG: hypothetical protein QME60_02800 [Verrucomicrobiota bacterium]|nr:hypothetical protein [Verrucomicrobiota bacterium]
MQLTDEQKQAVTTWAREGLGLSEIQKKLAADFGLTMTYMDIRFLVLELGLAVKDKNAPPPPKPALESPDDEKQQGFPDEDFEDEPPAGDRVAGAVKVELSRVGRPGALVNGKVTFSDGVTADWWLDQYGRLALDAGDKGRRPKPEDVRQFQAELRKLLQTCGYGI